MVHQFHPVMARNEILSAKRCILAGMLWKNEGRARKSCIIAGFHYASSGTSRAPRHHYACCCTHIACTAQRAKKEASCDASWLGLANEMRHLIHAWRTYVSFLEFSDSIHRPAEYALWTVALQNNMVALHQNFDRIPLVHLVTFSQRFGQHNTSQLIDFTDYTGRFHLFHLSCIYFLMITLRKLCFYYFDTIDEIPAEKCHSISFLSILFM